MKRIFLNLPTLVGLANLLAEKYLTSDSFHEADIVVTEESIACTGGKLIIYIGENKCDDAGVFIKNSLSEEVIYEVVSSALDSALITSDLVISAIRCNSKDYGEYFIKKLENMINAAAACIVEIDFSGKIFFNNKSFAETYGASEENLFSGNLFDIFDSDTVNYIRHIVQTITSGKPAEFSGLMKTASGKTLPVEGYVSALSGDVGHFEIIYEDVTEKLHRMQHVKKMEEQSVIAGFARHLSHNVMNALTAAGGFIRQIRAKTENTFHLQNLWHIINDKLLFIEEVVASYNDYTHAIALRKAEVIDIASFFKDLVASVAEKQIERSFTAYLYKFSDNFKLTYDFSKASSFEVPANRMFLKLAFCYILKDNIRYFSGNLPLDYRVTAETHGDSLTIYIVVENVEISEQIVETMFKPWDHRMLSQSFDYWGVVIASAVIENHDGVLTASREEARLRLTMKFNKTASYTNYI